VESNFLLSEESLPDSTIPHCQFHDISLKS
jgi:hypothetical protein